MTDALVRTHPPMPDPNDAEQNRMTAALSYLYLLILIPLAVGRDSPFVRYHLNQGVALVVLAILMLPLVCVIGFLSLIPVIGWLFALPILLLHAGTLLGLAVIGMYNATSRLMKPLPIIGGIFTFIQTQPPPRP